jgi:hypothetical protein
VKQQRTQSDDFYTWAFEQAKALRARRTESLDWENLAEELEDMARSEKRALQSHLEGVLTHLLKWKFQPSRRSKSWEASIKIGRLEFRESLDDNPGLKSKLDELTRSAYLKARIRAAAEMNLDESDLPQTCPWTLEQTTSEDFWPD